MQTAERSEEESGNQTSPVPADGILHCRPIRAIREWRREWGG